MGGEKGLGEEEESKWGREVDGLGIIIITTTTTIIITIIKA